MILRLVGESLGFRTGHMNLDVTMKCEECSSDKCVTKNLRQHVQANYDGPRVAFLSVVFDFLGNCGLRDGGHRKRTTSDSNDKGRREDYTTVRSGWRHERQPNGSLS